MVSPSARTRFVILCLGRTGSTHLQSMLDHHSQARCFGELFGDGEPPTFAGSGESDPAAFLEGLLASEDARAVGFKLPMNSISRHPELAPLIAADTGLAVIRLSRRNHLALLVSRRLVAETGVSQSIFGSYGDATVRLDPAGCVAALERIAAEEAELDALAEGHASFEITYEDLGDEQRLEQLQRFLGLDPEPLRSWFERLRTRPLTEVISNAEEVRAALRGSSYERWLDESPS